MSNIDKQALREAANAANSASCGNWESYKPHKGARGYEVKVGVKAVAQHCLKVDSVFIAAANPATVLALLDELEATEKRIAELEVREVNFSLPAELTVEDCDVLARPIEYGTGWNLAISSCEEKFIHALNAAGIRINREG